MNEREQERITKMMNPSRLIVSGVLFGSLLTTATWAMELPDELWVCVLSKLPLHTLGKVAPVSKKWREISEEDKLWQLHGFPSKKECMKFPFTTLDRAHLESLFKHKYLAGKGVFFWKLLEEVEPPSEVIKKINPLKYFACVPIEWKAKNIICTKKELNLIHYTFELVFYSEMMKMEHTYKILLYTLTLGGSWGEE
jgi:F-box domain